MDYYTYWHHQSALDSVKQLWAEARRMVSHYDYALNKYQHALRICNQFGFEATASELLCDLSVMATQYRLFEDALQYARKCDPTYPKGYLAQARACEGLCKCRPEGAMYLDTCFNNYARYFQMTKDHNAFVQALKLATEFDVPINKALMDSAKGNVLKIVDKLNQKEWCTAKHMQALLSQEPLSLSLSHLLCLNGLEPHVLRDLIKNGVKVTTEDFENAISVLSDNKVKLLKVLTSEVKGSPDYVGLCYRTIRDKPVLARHLFMCWAQPDTITELDSKVSDEFIWMCDCIAKKCNSHERTSLVKKALEKGDGEFADQLLSAGSINEREINLCLLLSYVAQPVFHLSTASSILTHYLKQSIIFESTSDDSFKSVMDTNCDTLKKASFLSILLNRCSFDALDMQSSFIDEITKFCLKTENMNLLQLACSRCKFPENGVVVNKQGQSPLHLAAQAECSEASQEICRILSEHIDPRIEDADGKKALQLIPTCKSKKSQKKQGPNDQRFKILFRAQQVFPNKVLKATGCTKNEKLSCNDMSTATILPVQDCSTLDCGFQQGKDPLDAHIDRLKAKEPSYFTLIPEPTGHFVSRTIKCHVNEEGNISVDTQGTADEPHCEVNVLQHLNPRDDFADTQSMAADGPQDEGNVMQHLNKIGDDQFDFNDLPWEVECTENVLKFLKSQHPLKYKVVEKICCIAKGEFRKKMCKKVKSSIQLYEARITKSVRILWEVAVQFSPRCTGHENSSHKFSEVIRVWSVVLDHDDINHNIRMIEKSHADGQNAAIKIMLHSTAQEECKIHNGVRIPRIFTLENKGTTPYVPCTRFQSTERNVITFYSLSSATVKCVLTGENIRRDFPFKVWHKEHDIINQPYGETAIVLLGRSGTGKTTCCLYRLWNEFHSYWTGNRVENPAIPRRLIPFMSVRSETVEAVAGSIANVSTLNPCESQNSKSSLSQNHLQLEHLHQVFVTKNPILCAQMKKRFYDLAAGSENCKMHVPFEDYCIPTCLEDVEDLAYPLFITAHQFYNILDNSLGQDETFFPRFDGILTVKVLSSEYDQDNEETILNFDDSDDDDDDLDLDGEHVVDQTKLQSPAKQSLTEISSSYFVKQIWPEIIRKLSSPQAKTLDPLLVWMEIKSIIKGSVQAMKNDKGYLSLEEYEVVGKKMAPNFVGKRADI